MDTGASLVCCPVCTLYMREGVSLESHLNTHPKEQVIEALVRYCVTSSNAGQENNASAIESIPASQIASCQQHDQSIMECTPAPMQAAQYPTFGSSHFTAAITYQQFLSSNASATGTVIPQYVSVPTILAAPNATHGEPGQPTIMPVLYNPYLMQQQQQQQQVQFYNSVRTPPQPPLLRQILPTSVPTPVPLFPVTQHMGLATSCAPGNAFQQSNNCSMSSTSTLLQLSQNTQTNISSSTSSVLHVAQVASPAPDTVSNHVIREQNSNVSCEDNINLSTSNQSSPKSPRSNVPVQCNEQQRTVGTEATTSFGPGEVPESTHDSTYENGLSNNSLAVPLDDDANTTTVSQTNCTNYEDFCTYEKTEEKIYNLETENERPNINFEKEEDKGEVQHDACVHLNRTQAVSPGLRVRTDLNNVAIDATQPKNSVQLSSTTDECVLNSIEMSKMNSKGKMKGSDEISDISDIIRNGDETSDLSEIMRGGLVVPLPQEADNNEYITSDCSFPDEFSEVPNQQTASTTQTLLDSSKDSCNNLNSTEASNKILNFDTSRQVNIIEIDGMHILVPSQFLENPAGVLDRKVTVIQSATTTPASTSTSSSGMKEDQDVSKVETETHTLVNLDMQTDEMMPPRGELSEQESVGGNDNSVWVQAFRERDEDVSTSYDLLARESWEASDGSDIEGCGDDLITESTTDRNSTEHTMTPPVEKKKEKLTTVYKCWSCGESFNCPKERRVHQSTKHRREGESSSTSIKLKSRSNLLVKGKQKIRKVKEESQEDNELCVKSEPAQFAQVFVKSHEQAKLEDAQGNDTGCLPDAKLDEEKEVNEEASMLRYSCSRCDGSFINLKCLQRHNRITHRDHTDFKHICGTCKQKFSTDSLYHAHLKIHPLECTRCGKYFYRRQNLNLHIRRHLGIKPFKCAICDKAFVTKQKLAEHTNCHTGNSPLKCTLCSESFRRYSNLIQHKNRYHLKLKKKIKDFICHCGEVFHSKKKLEWHKEIHDEKPKSCTFCSERFVHAASLTRHVRRAHDERYVPKIGRENENVECPVCACVFLKSSLHVHMRVHSGEKPFQCHICAKGFTTKWNLQLHRWTHASRSTKPFKCTLCKSAFFRRSDYTGHMHSHRNERPYTCNYCGCQFIRKYNCIRHVKEHEAVKSFACNVCNKTFHRSYYLKEHMRIHSGVRPFACHICGKASSTKSNHNKHVKIHHAREPVNTEG